MSLKKIRISQRKATRRYDEKLRNSGLIRLQKYVSPQEKEAIDELLRQLRDTSASNGEQAHIQ